MAGDNSQNSFRRGVMSLVLLSLLKQGDMYGYQLVQEIEKQSGGRIVTQEGSLYPVLYKLLDQGLILDRKVLVGKRMQRVYYHLEPAGEERLKELIREYEEITHGVFQIIKEEKKNEEYAGCSAVSLGDPMANSWELDEKEENTLAGSGLRPGLCY